MRRTVVLSSVVSSLVAVLVVLLAQSIVTPQRTSAQSGAAQEVRASAFVLVGSDGTVLDSLAPGMEGSGSLVLYDATGQHRSFVGGTGVIGVWDTNGAIRANLFVNNSTGNSGLEVRDANGTVRIQNLYQPSNDLSRVILLDPGEKIRLALGALPDTNGANSGGYGLRLRDIDGNIAAEFP